MIRSIDGKTPQIHPSVFVSEAAYIVGDVIIGEGTSIWPGAVIRGDYGRIVIGRNCSIQDNCVLHTDDYLELGDNVLMTHGAVIHGGKVGNNVMIGVNAVCLEDCDVGDYVLIGARSHRDGNRHTQRVAGDRSARSHPRAARGAPPAPPGPHRPLQGKRPAVHRRRPGPANPGHRVGESALTLTLSQRERGFGC